MWSFIHDSDLHYGYDEVNPRNVKLDNPREIANADAEFVIVTGDITDHGYDHINVKLNCCRDEKYDELEAFRTYYKNYIERRGKRVYLCAGNHDRGRKIFKIYKHSPVLKYIRDVEGGLEYSFTHKEVKFICCGIYPKNLTWLRSQLINVETPTIIYFHYNLTGPYSDWWSDREKDEFHQCITGYNILALLVGHRHASRRSYWNGILVINSANSFSYIRYRPDTQDLDVKFS